MKISKEVYDELVEWRKNLSTLDVPLVNKIAISKLPSIIVNWWDDSYIPMAKNNNRLIAIIRWVNGEDVFEVEKPKKWVVRSKETDSTGKYHYSILSHFSGLPSTEYYFVYEEDGATKFDTKEEAESWANAHQEVVEVEE